MPQLKLLKSLMVTVTGAFFGFYAVQLFIPVKPSQNRFLASATMSKLGSNQYAKSIFDLKIKNDVLAENPAEISTVKVSVEAFQDLTPGLTYTWVLPEGAEILQGQAQGPIPELKADQSQEFMIQLKGYSHEMNSHVVFVVKGDINNNLIDQNVIVSSRPEDSFEYVVQKRTEASTKTANKLGIPKSNSAIDPSKVVY